MKLIWRILAVPALAIVPAMAAQITQMQNDVVAVAVDRVEMTEVKSDRVQFDVMAHVTASRKLKIKRIRFEEMRLQGLPVYMGPLEEQVELEKGVAMNLPPIPSTVYLRDLHSLEPVEQAVREGKATVQGRARVDLDLSVLDRVATGQWTVRADMPTAMSAPVEVPGGEAGRAVTLATLDAAQLALNVGDPVFGILDRSRSKSDEDLRAQYTPSLVVAESHYSLQVKDKLRLDFVVRGMGIRVSEDKFVVPGELLEPWKYDADAATSIETGTASLIKDSTDLLVWPAGGSLDEALARSLSKATIQVVRKPGGTERTRVPVSKEGTEIHLARRDSDDNFAVLRFTRPQDNGTAVPLAPEQSRRNDTWDRLTLFRVDSKGSLQVLATPASRKDNRIILEDPVDDGAFGSALIGPDGGLGMIQDERSGVILHRQW